MKCLDIAIDWMEGWGNKPEIYMLVDEFPDMSNVVYEWIDNLYFAEEDNLVKFYSYTKPGNGFGGRKFDIKVLANNKVNNMTLIGPWSSRCRVMNKYFHHSIEVAATDDREVWKRGHTFYGCQMIIYFVEEGLKKFIPNVSLRLIIEEGNYYNTTMSRDQANITGGGSDIYYEILLNGKDKKELFKEGYLKKIGIREKGRIELSKDSEFKITGR